ncbi:hypothetical protein GIB67_029849 [Kingdonia uniflora]|uniref:Uncharacterized protein n=1 Tax=Kingdonia uniflora TaxID=39325 RepID=A0A7J7NIY0_9MAGN|nr:hypothetical protein GIB67_029849 [Kingdonia uniflora]
MDQGSRGKTPANTLQGGKAIAGVKVVATMAAHIVEGGCILAFWTARIWTPVSCVLSERDYAW